MKSARATTDQRRDPTRSRLIVGVDLGTSHTVVAACPLPIPGATAASPEVFAIPQLVTAQEAEPRPLLPSCLYAPLGDEPHADRWGTLPWLVGEHARRRGREVPGRAVTSAKSWLTHAAADRTAAILPWGIDPGEEVPRISPVGASARVLEHVRLAWNAEHPHHPLERQQVILTVPASFDPIARELTLRAAAQAGLDVRLLEEPQAAFYDYLARHGTATLDALARERGAASVLVCDVGGGTTDLTLIRAVVDAEGALDLQRVAVGRHLLLGGDNMDLALAHHVERRLVPEGQHLDPRRFAALVLACRNAKEQLLDPGGPPTTRIAIAGAGSALVGSTFSAEVTRGEVGEIVLEGFFPAIARDAEPARVRGGLVAFGLPYERDPAITRHLASFFARHAAALRQPAGASSAETTGLDGTGPDALLLNGGVFHGARLAHRLVETVSSWSPAPLELLPAQDPELAVARGAVAYGLALAGHGTTIGGGAPSAFYIALDAGAARGARRLLCAVPRGAKEGELFVASRHPLALRMGEPVRFEVFSGDSAIPHAPGAIVTLDAAALETGQFAALPPVTMEFATEANATELAVHLEGELTPLGTLELACVAAGSTASPGAARQRFRLAFDLRGAPASTPPPPAASPASDAEPTSRDRRPSVAPRALHHHLNEAVAALDLVFGKGRADAKPRDTKDLWRTLEKLLGDRSEWTTETARALFDALAPNARARRRSPDHERVFWMLAGFCLRPGFGEPRDPRRIALLVPTFAEGLAFPSEARGWQQFFIAWRRVVGGLEERTQTAIRDKLDPFLAPAESKLKKPKGFAPLAHDELLELASWLER
ncbi:MAG: Hsp70 family protein, partial [Polyangiaceae bacterium]|nr:Hsp70 family protein [Polyangiaceae bacterium]